MIPESDFVEFYEVGYDEDDPPCTINTYLYLLSCQQYVIACICFSISKPFRRPVYTNPFYLVSLLALIIYQTLLIYRDEEWSRETYALVDLPKNFRYITLGLCLANFIASYAFEKLFIDWFGRFWNSRKQNKMIMERENLVKQIESGEKTVKFVKPEASCALNVVKSIEMAAKE